MKISHILVKKEKKNIRNRHYVVGYNFQINLKVQQMTLLQEVIFL